MNRHTAGSRRSSARALSRALRLAAATALVVVASVVGAAVPASAATIDCTPMGDPACRTLVPVVECVWAELDGSRTVVWGYDNPSPTVLHIDVGPKNGMSPGADDQGQATEFLPGRHLNVFTTHVPGTSASWRLGNSTASLSGGTAACVTKPVSQIGSFLALGLVVLLIAIAVPVSVRSRRPLVLEGVTRSAR